MAMASNKFIMCRSKSCPNSFLEGIEVGNVQFKQERERGNAQSVSIIKNKSTTTISLPRSRIHCSMFYCYNDRHENLNDIN